MNSANEGHWKAEAEEKEHELLERWPWILPLATGIFLGAAVFEMAPEALGKAGTQAWFWIPAGLLIFIRHFGYRYGLGHRRVSLPGLCKLERDQVGILA